MSTRRHKFVFSIVSAILWCALPLVSYADTTPADTAATADAGAATTPAATTPAPNPTYSYNADGVLSCDASQFAAPASIGSNAATQAAYVPVDSSTLDVNTYTDVYHQCILRPVVDSEKRAATVAITKQIYNAMQTGRNGNPEYVVSEGPEEVLGASDPAELAFLQDSGVWNNVNIDMQASLKHANAASYEADRGGSEAMSPKCPYQGSLNSYWSGQAYNAATFFTDFLNASQPQCDPVIENTVLSDISSGRIARQRQYQQDQWNWNNGFYSRTDANGNIITPGILSQQLYSQALQSPFNQLQNANDIGQMVGALYSGLGTQILGGQNGLAGLGQSVASQPSYLTQVATESAQGLQSAALNAGIQILASQQQLESNLYNLMSSIANNLLQTETQLKTAETQCWASVIANVCAPGTLKADGTCTATVTTCTAQQITDNTCGTGATLKVATSTAFSSAVINSVNGPASFVSAIATSVQTSKSALGIIQNLIQGITNTASLDAQSQALQQLDTLVAQKQLHTQTDVQNASQQQSSIAGLMSTLLQTTAQTWGGSGTDGSSNIAWDGTTNPGNGWCNVNNPATIQAWQQAWKQ